MSFIRTNPNNDLGVPEGLVDSEVQDAFDRFYENIYIILDQFYPVSSVKLSNRDPPFVTPQIKLMLRKKNQLMRRGRLEAANAIAERIKKAIITTNSNNFCDIKNVKELWEKVRQASGKGKSGPCNNPNITAEMLNEHYSKVSTDPKYEAPTLKSTATLPEAFLTETQIFHLLDHLKPTAAGNDGLPSWFLRIAAPLVSRPLTTLFNLSLSWSVVPKQWKTSVITPVAKIPRPATCSDFRPISVTPILSRLLEKMVVRTFVYPIFDHPLHAKQFNA